MDTYVEAELEKQKFLPTQNSNSFLGRGSKKLSGTSSSLLSFPQRRESS